MAGDSRIAERKRAPASSASEGSPLNSCSTELNTHRFWLTAPSRGAQFSAARLAVRTVFSLDARTTPDACPHGGIVRSLTAATESLGLLAPSRSLHDESV